MSLTIGRSPPAPSSPSSFSACPSPPVIAAAALAGFLLARTDASEIEPLPDGPPVALSQTLGTAALWLAIWLVPLLAVSVLFGRDHVTTDIALFFSKLAVVAFGGAYSVLAYMAQQAVEIYGWLSAGEMLDGLGLAETTPGPLILVTEFVGFLAGYRQGGEPALAFGLLGAGIALWATFVPSFLFIFTGAPYVERLTANPQACRRAAWRHRRRRRRDPQFEFVVCAARPVRSRRGPLARTLARCGRPTSRSLNVDAVLLAVLARRHAALAAPRHSRHARADGDGRSCLVVAGRPMKRASGAGRTDRRRAP